MITKRAYDEVAAAIREAKEAAIDSIDVAAIGDAQARIADRFAKDNPNFERRTFDIACNPDAHSVAREERSLPGGICDDLE